MSTVTISSAESLLARFVASLQPDEEWQDRALCAQTDPEAFFPDKGGSTREAKQICMRCPVRDECLQYALDHDERHGVWGGKAERERRRMKNNMAAGSASPAAAGTSDKVHAA